LTVINPVSNVALGFSGEAGEAEEAEEAETGFLDSPV